MVNNGFTPVSINDLIIKRIDKIFRKAGFSTRASYIQDRLRDALEKDEKKYGDGDAIKKLDSTKL